ncbi:DUF3784 domain-containing protein [Listeria monocytogenes]|nr:DUF3784 domain-containing protein [Listeria monocytogenes]
MYKNNRYPAKDTTVIFLFPFILIFIVCGIQLLRRKWLTLIASYNTASRKEREKINAKSLGRFVGSVLIICSFLIFIITFLPAPIVISLFIGLTIVIAIGSVIYASTSNKFKNDN